ncbi:hypothetical protein [Pseudomonas fluorescens]|uniref:hypothetical protein n=1 Tax=Pseudomonas fluorescens TaxID=294 RepID=UPI0018C54852|nr:hypothetical protein [Pseudomonas fluorescens]
MKTIRPGQLVYWRNTAAIVLELKGLTDAVIRTVDHSKLEIAHVVDLALSPSSSEPTRASHLFSTDKKWDEVVERFEMIRPLLESGRRQLIDVQLVANAAGKSVPTIYRWAAAKTECNT